MLDRCAWCAEPFTPDYRRRYCSKACRLAMGHYLEAAPGWRAQLAQLDAAAAGWVRHKKPVPVYLRNLIADLRAQLDRGR